MDLEAPECLDLDLLLDILIKGIYMYILDVNILISQFIKTLVLGPTRREEWRDSS